MKSKLIVKLLRAFHQPSRARVSRLMRLSYQAKLKAAWRDQVVNGFNGSIRP